MIYFNFFHLDKYASCKTREVDFVDHDQEKNQGVETKPGCKNPRSIGDLWKVSISNWYFVSLFLGCMCSSSTQSRRRISSRCILFLHIENSFVFQLRHRLKDTSQFFVGKKTVMGLALGRTKEEESEKDLHAVSQCLLSGQKRGLLVRHLTLLHSD